MRNALIKCWFDGKLPTRDDIEVKCYIDTFHRLLSIPLSIESVEEQQVLNVGRLKIIY